MGYEEIKKQYPRRVQDLGNEPYFVIFTETSATGSYDEREDFLEQKVFLNEGEWKDEITKLTNSKTVFKAAKVIPAKITTTVSVDIK